MQKETNRVLALNLEKVEKVAREELEQAAEEGLGDLMESAVEAPLAPKTSDTRGRSAKKSPAAKLVPKGIVAGLAAALGRK